MSSSSDESDDAGRSLLKRAGLPERFGSRKSTERPSFRGGGDYERRRSGGRAMYDDDDIPVTKYDLMSATERREEQARIAAGVKQVASCQSFCTLAGSPHGSTNRQPHRYRWHFELGAESHSYLQRAPFIESGFRYIEYARLLESAFPWYQMKTNKHGCSKSNHKWKYIIRAKFIKNITLVIQKIIIVIIHIRFLFFETFDFAGESSDTHIEVVFTRFMIPDSGLQMKRMDICN